MNTGNRIEKIREFFCGSNKLFAEKLGENESTTSNWVRREDNIGLDVIKKIKNAFPDISLDWLIAEEGEMLKKTGNISITDSPNSMANTGNQGDNCQQMNGISEKAMKDILDGFQNIMQTHQQQTEELISVINKLVEKYGR